MAIKRRKGAQRVLLGERIRLTENVTWNGVKVPIGTMGTVYAQGRFRAVHFDGMPRLQANGFPFGIGGDIAQTYVPRWAEVLS